MTEWTWCLLFGIGTLLWGQVIISVPNKILFFNKSESKTESLAEPAIEEEDVDIESKGKFLWVRGFSRIRTQVS